MAPAAPAAPVAPVAPVRPAAPVPAAVRRGVRTKGPFLALVLPAVLGVAAMVLLRDSTTVGTGVSGFVMALLAAPLLPAFGAPLRTGSLALPAAASAVLWFVLGTFAAQRATRSGAGGWGRFWSEYVWLTSCVWVGAILAVVAANLVLGRVLL